MHMLPQIGTMFFSLSMCSINDTVHVAVAITVHKK